MHILHKGLRCSKCFKSSKKLLLQGETDLNDVILLKITFKNIQLEIKYAKKNTKNF